MDHSESIIDRISDSFLKMIEEYPESPGLICFRKEKVF